MAEFTFICNVCKQPEPLAFSHEHHVIPKSAGGSNSHTNLILICHDCHDHIHSISVMLRGKKAYTVEDALLHVFPSNNPARTRILELATIVNKYFLLKKEGELVLDENFEEPLSISLPRKYKAKLKLLSSETHNPATNRKYGMASYARHVLISHLISLLGK